MKGVNKQFHSCSRDILSCLLHLLMDVTVPQPLLVNLLDHVNDFIARYITQETNFEELWALYLVRVFLYIYEFVLKIDVYFTTVENKLNNAF